MDGEESKNRNYDIYANAQAIRSQLSNKIADSNTARIQSSKQKGSECVKNRSFRTATVCLGLLCVLLLTVVIVLCVKHTQEREQFIFNNDNLTKERDQLKRETNEFQMTLGKVDGWIYYQSSFYYISSEKKSWSESKIDCIERGAYLVIINNREEQEFVVNITVGIIIWIGLTDSDEEGTWKWVDGSIPTSVFWRDTEPGGNSGENCALIDSPKWADYSCDSEIKWICEKSFAKEPIT
ncbi:CD209 antigen-like protein E [Xyrauchen texanus]|uniref:CD209 antigen-like protein E n=1 Tax=Xyrauchen texanus TaxID=154827 RepID=UPI0022419DD1|nr:CD209 antigen-like protein E [Xyrauchen texanus]